MVKKSDSEIEKTGLIPDDDLLSANDVDAVLQRRMAIDGRRHLSALEVVGGNGGLPVVGYVADTAGRLAATEEVQAEVVEHGPVGRRGTGALDAGDDGGGAVVPEAHGLGHTVAQPVAAVARGAHLTVPPHAVGGGESGDYSNGLQC